MVKCMRSIIASLLLCCLAGPALAQTTSIRGAIKGTSTADPVTSTSVNANKTALDVNIASGGGSGGTASNFDSLTSNITRTLVSAADTVDGSSRSATR